MKGSRDRSEPCSRSDGLKWALLAKAGVAFQGVWIMILVGNRESKWDGLQEPGTRRSTWFALTLLKGFYSFVLLEKR